MQTIHARYIKKSAFIRNLLEACEITQNVNGESIWSLVIAKYAPTPILVTFSNISGRPKDIVTICLYNINSPYIPS